MHRFAAASAVAAVAIAGGAVTLVFLLDPLPEAGLSPYTALVRRARILGLVGNDHAERRGRPSGCPYGEPSWA